MGSEASPTCWRSGSLESRPAGGTTAAASVFWDLGVWDLPACLSNQLLTLHPCDPDANDPHPDAQTQPCAPTKPFADVETKAQAGEVTRHVVSSPWAG